MSTPAWIDLATAPSAAVSSFFCRRSIYTDGPRNTVGIGTAFLCRRSDKRVPTYSMPKGRSRRQPSAYAYADEVRPEAVGIEGNSGSVSSCDLDTLFPKSLSRTQHPEGDEGTHRDHAATEREEFLRRTNLCVFSASFLLFL